MEDQLVLSSAAPPTSIDHGLLEAILHLPFYELYYAGLSNLHHCLL
jgi:hypothetical protein